MLTYHTKSFTSKKAPRRISISNLLLNRYLAADMQLYALSLALTLAMWRWRRGAIFALTAFLAGTITLIFGLAYAWRLIPTYVMHCPE